MKIVICDYKEAFSSAGISYSIQYLKTNLGTNDEVLFHEYDGDQDKLVSILKDADALLTGYLEINKSILDRVNDLKIISIMATGYNSIDINEVARKKIRVATAADYCTQEVAEHAICLLLALNRKLKHYLNEIDKRFTWNYASTSGLKRLEGTTLGIFGLGQIGRAIAKRAQAFGINVIGYDPYISKKIIDDCDITLVSIEELLSTADHISLNMLLTEDNINFLNKDKFKKMTKKPYIINVGRGALINEKDLVEALDYGLIEGAALDVLDTESPELMNHPLVNRENVILTPHSAFYSDTSIIEVQRKACNNILHFLKGEVDKVFKLVN